MAHEEVSRVTHEAGFATWNMDIIVGSRAETLEVVERFVSRGGEDVEPGRPLAWELDDLGADYPGQRHACNAAFVQTLPSRDQTTGFFVARLRRVD